MGKDARNHFGRDNGLPEDAGSLYRGLEGLRSRLDNRETNPLSVSERLERKFGLGNKPVVRRLLYLRLEVLVSKLGAPMLALIDESVAQAAGTLEPDHYFCRAIVRKLNEAGYGDKKPEGGDESW